MGPQPFTAQFSAFELADQVRRRYGQMLDLVLQRQETPFRIVLERPTVRLRAYREAGQNDPILVMVPAPIKRGYIWDLAPSISVVQACIRAGFGTYLLEWTEAVHDSGRSGLAVYADDLIADCLDAIGRPVVLAGHSLGGTFAAIFASLHPERVRGLVLLEAPLCFGDDAGSIAALVRKSRLATEVRDDGNRIPGTALNVFSVTASPDSFVWWRWLDRIASMDDPVALRTHDLVERWALDEFPMPGALADQVARDLYRKDRFMRGTLVINGRRAAAASVVAPVIGVFDPQSDVVAPGSVLPFFDAAQGRDRRVLEYHGDVGVGLRHVGVLVGRSAHRHLWPRILAWIRERYAVSSVGREPRRAAKRLKVRSEIREIEK